MLFFKIDLTWQNFNKSKILIENVFLKQKNFKINEFKNTIFSKKTFLISNHLLVESLNSLMNNL